MVDAVQVCAMSASSAPWMDPNEFMMAQYGTVGGTHQEYQTSMEMKTGATTGGIKHKRRTNTGKLNFFTDRFE